MCQNSRPVDHALSGAWRPKSPRKTASDYIFKLMGACSIALAGREVLDERSHLLIQSDLLQVLLGLGGKVRLLCADGGRAAKLQVSQEAAAEGAPRVEEALQALHVGQEVDDVLVREVLAGRNGACTTPVCCTIRVARTAAFRCFDWTTTAAQ